MAARVPAWKRLGLKLKGASDDSSAPAPAPTPTPSNVGQARINGSPASALKRKLPLSQTSYNSNNNYAQTPNKRLRGGDDQTPGSQRKSVSFSADTKTTSVELAAKKAKKPKKPKKEPAPKAETNLEPSLEYLRQWHNSRDSWKFNKNHQTLLIKYLFGDEAKIPSADIPIFYQYIRDLKGGVRTRLREQAAEVSKKDMDQGAGGFPASTKDKEAKQAQYEEVISRFLQDLSSSSNDTNANGKRSLDETEYVIRTADPVIKQRLLKRIRAETVRGELASCSDSEETSTTAMEVSKATETTTTTSSSSSSSTATARQEPPAAADSRPRRTDGSQQPTKRRRLRNVRTDISSDESSSSDSDSDSDSSDDESEDGGMENAPGPNDKSSDSDSSTSSESSSDSDSESDSATEGGEEAEESSSSSSSSSDSDSE